MRFKLQRSLMCHPVAVNQRFYATGELARGCSFCLFCFVFMS